MARAKTRTRRRERKSVPKGRAYIQSTFNNTLITLTDPEGNVIAPGSGGTMGFKGARQGPACAAHRAAQTTARKGPDHGTQYRAGIWVATEDQKRQAEQFVIELKKSGRFKREIVTEIEQAKTFYLAEDYHQDYIATTGRACHVTNPW